MSIKISYIIVYCLYAVQIQAQQPVQSHTNIIKLLENINSNIQLVNKNLSQPCKKVFEKDFEKADTTGIRKKTIENLLSTSHYLINTYKSPSEDCSNDEIKTTAKATDKLINKLKTLITQIEKSSKKKLVRLAIKIVDDSTNQPLKPAVTIVPADTDKMMKAIFVKQKDTTGFIYDSLLVGKKYLVKVEDSLYFEYNHEFFITKDLDTTIQLKKKPNALRGISKKENAKEVSSPAYTIREFIKEHTPLFISICVLFFLALTGTVLFISRIVKDNSKFNRENRRKMNVISPLDEDSKKEDMSEVLNNVTLPKALPEQIKNEQPEALVAEDSKVIAAVSKERSFICEIMMTAGPRKKFMSEPDADRDLGEDVCGFVSDTKDVLLWVLDGTSDLHCLKNPVDNREYFSSRLLAQFLAEKLRKGFIEKSEVEFDKIVTDAIQEVKEDFLLLIDQLPEDEKNLLRKNIENKNFPECATTILIARLSLNGDFTAYRSGDSKMFLFRVNNDNEIELVETSFETKDEKSDDRIFFRIKLNEHKKFDILHNKPVNEIINEKNIMATICFTDGIGMDTEFLLREEYRKKPQQIRKEIIYQLQGTGDDKSICFVEIKDRIIN